MLPCMRVARRLPLRGDAAPRGGRGPGRALCLPWPGPGASQRPGRTGHSQALTVAVGVVGGIPVGVQGRVAAVVEAVVGRGGAEAEVGVAAGKAVCERVWGSARR